MRKTNNTGGQLDANGSALTIHGDVNNAGGNIDVESGGSVTIFGAVTGGIADIGSAATLDFAGTANLDTINFENGAPGTLVLGQQTGTVGGVIGNFGNVEFAGNGYPTEHDVIDFAGVQAAASPQLYYNATTNQLTLSDSASDSVTVTFAAGDQFTASDFLLGSDASGGTTVTFEEAPVANNVNLNALSGNGWVSDAADGRSFRLVTNSTDWVTANAQAAADGAYLATITNPTELAFVQSIIGSNTVWIGGSDAAVDGQWLWTGGPYAGQQFWTAPGGENQSFQGYSVGAYANWSPGEPNNFFGYPEQSLEMYGNGHGNGIDNDQNGGWNDAQSSISNPYVEESGGTGPVFDESLPTTFQASVLLTAVSNPGGGVLTIDGLTAKGVDFEQTPNGGSVTLNNNGTLTYTPATEYTGTDSFSYTVTDGVVNSTATVTFTVEPVAHWEGGVQGDWTTASSWADGYGNAMGVPNYNNDVDADAVGNYTLTITNGDAATANSLTISSLGADVQESGGSLAINGALTIEAGSFSLIGGTLVAGSIYVGAQGNFIAEGAVQAPLDNDGGIVDTYGNLSLWGAVTGSGTFNIETGNILEFGNSVAAGATVAFAGATGTLQLDNSAAFAATISGFTGNDVIDLTDLAYASSGETVSWTQGVNGNVNLGTLTINDNGTTEYFTLSGSYSPNNFLLAPDSGAASAPGHPGTEVVFTSPAEYSYVTDFAKNDNIQSTLISQFPAGAFTADNSFATPFDITANGGNNFYDGFTHGSTLTINVAIPDATNVYTLMNAYAPYSGDQIATVEFIGSAGATETFALVAGTDIRDFFQGNYADSINGTTTENAFTVYDTVGGAGTGNSSSGSYGTYNID